MTYIHKNEIVRITISDSKIVDVLIYPEKPEIKNFWGKIIQEYRPKKYTIFGDLFNSIEECIKSNNENKLFYKLEYVDGVVKSKPNYTIYFKNIDSITELNKYHVVSFDTFVNAQHYAKLLVGNKLNGDSDFIYLSYLDLC